MSTTNEPASDAAKRAADRIRARALNATRAELEQIDAHEEMLRELEGVGLWIPPEESTNA